MIASRQIVAALEAILARELGPVESEISHLVKTSSGRSRQNWAFDLRWEDAEGVHSEELILRCDPPGGLVDTDRAVEYAVLASLEPTPVPAPGVRWLDSDGRFFGRPALVMRRAVGFCDYYILSGDRPAQERVALAARFCGLLAQVHGLDWASTDLPEVLSDPGPRAAEVELRRWEAILREDQREAYPELELGIWWLGRNAPLSPRTVLVHSDFKPGNVLLDASDPAGGAMTLLDWELAHLGDPAEDLGWMTQPLRQREHYVAGRWEAAQIIEAYEAASGQPVDRDAVRWWAMFATFRTAVMQVSGLRAFLEGRSDESYRPSAPVLRTLVELIDTGA